MTAQTVRRLAFKVNAVDLSNLESIAATIRQAGQPFVTKTDALRACLQAAAVDPTSVLRAAAK